MPECPRCHYTLNAQAVVCPACGMQLKAYGHPGIPLYRAQGETSLCATCVYDADDSCTFPKRPHARECTLYCDRTQPVAPKATYSRVFLLRAWFRRYAGWFLLAGVIGVSILWAMS